MCARACVRAYVCACVHARARACVRACVCGFECVHIGELLLPVSYPKIMCCQLLRVNIATGGDLPIKPPANQTTRFPPQTSDIIINYYCSDRTASCNTNKECDTGAWRCFVERLLRRLEVIDEWDSSSQVTRQCLHYR